MGAGPIPPAVTSTESLPAGDVVSSPMVGAAYLQPQPEAPPFVRVGDKVAAGQTLLIIEAMKTMNTIAAPRAGVVRAILVADGQPVEFGQPLAREFDRQFLVTMGVVATDHDMFEVGHPAQHIPDARQQDTNTLGAVG